MISTTALYRRRAHSPTGKPVVLCLRPHRKLSKERAQAVSSYLLSTGAINPGNVKVVGYGFERPLLPNKTLANKAQNRRVDIVISPHAKTE